MLLTITLYSLLVEFKIMVDKWKCLINNGKEKLEYSQEAMIREMD